MGNTNDFTSGHHVIANSKACDDVTILQQQQQYVSSAHCTQNFSVDSKETTMKMEIKEKEIRNEINMIVFVTLVLSYVKCHGMHMHNDVQSYNRHVSEYLFLAGADSSQRLHGCHLPHFFSLSLTSSANDEYIIYIYSNQFEHKFSFLCWKMWNKSKTLSRWTMESW